MLAPDIVAPPWDDDEDDDEEEDEDEDEDEDEEATPLLLLEPYFTSKSGSHP